MSLLKPPPPEVTRRKYYVRMDEPLAQKMEKYAEFLAANAANHVTVDHVIAQALDFVFRKDGEFNTWLAEHPGNPPAKTPRGNASKPNGSTIAAEKAPETNTSVRLTI